MNRKLYETVYLRFQSKALEHYEEAIALLSGKKRPENIADVLEYHILELKHAEDGISLLQLRFQEDVLKSDTEPEPVYWWKSIVEKLEAIEKNTAPPPPKPVTLSASDLAIRSSSFRESQRAKPPITPVEDNNEE